MTQLFSNCLVLFTLLLLSACNGASLFSNKHSEEMLMLKTAMAQCDSRQDEYNQRLQQQGKQLESQGRQLDKISGAQEIALETLSHSLEHPANSPVEAALCAPQETQPEKLVVGRHEQVWLEDIQLALPARIDTGAETASLDARNIERFERNGKRWVRFEILHPDTGEALQLERRLKRTVSIIQSNTSEAERRPVIKLGITMGHVTQSAEFTLSNRSHLDYQLLIGRNILKDVMVVDVSKINVAPPVLADK